MGTYIKLKSIQSHILPKYLLSDSHIIKGKWGQHKVKSIHSRILYPSCNRFFVGKSQSFSFYILYKFEVEVLNKYVNEAAALSLDQLLDFYPVAEKMMCDDGVLATFVVSLRHGGHGNGI